MTADGPALWGVVCGVLIGGTYVFLQRRALRKQRATTAANQPPGVGVLVPGALLRLAVVAVALFAVLQYTDVNKFWLTGSFFVTYTAPLLIQLKQMIFPNK
jgi:cytochrome c-type biogenesis protein CcmH/NrfG